MLGNQTMGQKRDSTLSLLVLTQSCAPVGTDCHLTLPFAYLTSYLDYEQLEAGGHVTWGDSKAHGAGELKLLTTWSKWDPPRKGIHKISLPKLVVVLTIYAHEALQDRTT